MYKEKIETKDLILKKHLWMITIKGGSNYEQIS
jgi:hypothetical protein